MVAAIVLFASCGLYQKYERPDVNTSGIFRDNVSLTDTLVATDTASFGNLPWRSLFTDPYLQRLIDAGLARADG